MSLSPQVGLQNLTSSDAYNIANSVIWPGTEVQNATPAMLWCSNCTAAEAKQMAASKRNQTVVNSSIMFASGLLGNFLALLVLARSRVSQRKTIFYRLVAGLVITDLTGTTATSPVVISVYVNNFKWIGGDVMCQYFAFMMEFAGATTVFIICAMSLERYVCIRHPYFYHTRLSPGHALNLLLGAWVAGLLLAILPLVGVGRNVLKYPHTWCFFDNYSPRLQDKIYCYLFGLFGVISIAITFVCNGTVMYTLTRVGCRHKLLTNSKTMARSISRRSRYDEIEMLVLLTVFTLTFGICWAPLVVRVIMNQTGTFPRDDKADLLMIRLASINQILDPWVYILLKKELLWRIISFIRAIFCRTSAKLHKCGHVPGVVRRERDVHRSAEEVSCLATCRGCLCEPPDVAGTYRNFSPSQTRRNQLCNSNSSLHIELTPPRQGRVLNGNMKEMSRKISATPISHV